MPDLHHLAAAYALDALDEEERTGFERHLAGCPSCAAEVASFAEVTEDLAWGLAADPRPELKAQVIAAAYGPGGEGAEAASLDDRRRRRPATWTWLSAAAAVVLAVVVVANLGQRDPAEDRIAAIEAADDAAVVALDLAAGPATLTYSLELGEAVLDGHALLAPPADNVYELWLIDDSGPASAGVFHPDHDTVVFDGVAAGHTFAITVEPAGGDGVPTGDVLVTAEL